ncbi:MAG: serine hydrolase, partial [Bacteroidota bacterium]
MLIKSSLHLITLSLILFLSLSCQRTDSEVSEKDLIGVWSGTLFQTEPVFDSLALQNDTVSFYRKGIETERIICNRSGRRLTGRGKNGLRVDIEFNINEQEVVGLFTHDLWVKSIPFQKKESIWTAKLEKPEIIDTDYLVFLEFFQDEEGKLQAII